MILDQLCFFFNDTATTEIYTLSLHDALPIWPPPSPTPDLQAAGRLAHVEHRLRRGRGPAEDAPVVEREPAAVAPALQDRKSTRLNSSHANISYAVFCLKKKKQNNIHLQLTQK